MYKNNPIYMNMKRKKSFFRHPDGQKKRGQPGYPLLWRQ